MDAESPKEHTGISGKLPPHGPIAMALLGPEILSYKLVRGVFSIAGSLWRSGRYVKGSAAVLPSLAGGEHGQHGEALRHPKCGEQNDVWCHRG